MANAIDLKDCTFFLLGGNGESLGIRIGEGNLTYTVSRNIEPRKARGNLWQMREMEQEPCDVSFQFVWDEMIGIGAEPPTVEDVLYAATTWKSTSNDPGAPFCVDLKVVADRRCTNAQGAEISKKTIIVFYEFHYLSLSHDLNNGAIDCQGLSNRVRPGVTRSEGGA